MKTRFFTAGHRYYFICLLSIAIVCGSASDGHAQNYYPDAVGNTWTLRSNDELDETLERVVTIEGSETIDGESLKVISDGTGDNPNKLFIKSEPHGILIFRAIASVDVFGEITIGYSPPQIFLPVPLMLGSAWTVSGKAKVPLFGAEITIEVANDATVVAVEPITVPAGTFQDCLKIEQQLQISLAGGGLQYPPQNSTMWLAPDIGIVKALSSGGVTFELIDYNLTIDGIVVAVEPKGKLATTWGALKKP